MDEKSCYLCHKAIGEEEQTYTIAGSGRKMHTRCYERITKPPIICPYCGAKVDVGHTFGDGMLVDRDFIIVHKNPAIKATKGQTHPYLVQHRGWASGANDPHDPSICPMSDMSLDKNGQPVDSRFTIDNSQLG